MTDPTVAKLARVLVQYAVPVHAGDWFEIRGTDLAAPLIREVMREALDVGAHPEVRVSIDGLEEIFYKHASEAQLSHVSDVTRLTMEKMDSRLYIMSEHNLKSLSNVDPAKQAARARSFREMSRIFMERSARGELRWCTTLYPTQASAQEAGMSLADYEEFVYRAMQLDQADPIAAWKAQGREQQRIADLLGATRELHFLGDGTDLRLNIAGRTWINCDGVKNFPDGEVFSAPHEDGVDGTVTFGFPAIYGGREVVGIRLTFAEGRVRAAEARQGEAFLNEMLGLDDGARVLGEVGIGTNYAIQQFTKNMLFDEKIGGTVHLALGAAYPESGGSNQSSLHWDMLLDLRRDGEIRADGRTVMQNGKWLI